VTFQEVVPSSKTMFLPKMLVISISLLAIALEIQPQGATVPTDLNIQAARDISAKTTLQNALVETLQGTGVSGGVVTVTQSCETAVNDFRVSKGTSLPQALDALVATDGGHSWSLEKGAVFLVPTAGLPPLLQTRIAEAQSRTRMT
jgi:hypothetical protein